MTIKEAQADRRKLESTILHAIVEFEAKYGEYTFYGLSHKRHNGSNYASGKVFEVHADVRILDGDPPVKPE